MAEKVYINRNGTLEQLELESCSKADLHVHSHYSDDFIQNYLPKLIGVRESYTSPKKALKTMQKKGMDFYTLSDHDEILGALELRKLCPEKSFLNCEYTVNVEKDSNQIIHSLIVGLDYPENIVTPLFDKEALELHKELLNYAQEGILKFKEFTDKLKLNRVFAHSPWQGNTKKPLTGKQLDGLTDLFEFLEINGDHQLENIITSEIAQRKNKILCAGTDSHHTRRIGNQYTVTLKPVETPYEFIRAFKRGEIAIGSKFNAPEIKQVLPPPQGNKERYKIVQQMFNGTVKELRNDTYLGILNYITHEWRIRKYPTLAAFFGIPAALSYLAGPEIGIPPFLVIESLLLATFPFNITRRERETVEKRTLDLYKDYHQHLQLEESKELRKEKEKIEKKITEIEKNYPGNLPHMVQNPEGWDKFVHESPLKKIDSLGSDYDLSSKLTDKKKTKWKLLKRKNKSSTAD